MTFRNRWLFIAFILVSIIGLIYQWRQHYRISDAYDLPRQLSTKIDTLNLVHIERHCNCPDWVEVSHLKRTGGPQPDDFIYLEAAKKDLEMAPTYPAYIEAGYFLRLQGSFYEGKSIPEDLLRQGGQKPEPARVFRYISSDLIKPQDIP